MQEKIYSQNKKVKLQSIEHEKYNYKFFKCLLPLMNLYVHLQSKSNISIATGPLIHNALAEKIESFILKHPPCYSLKRFGVMAPGTAWRF